jgi:serine/threonine protein kinase
MGEAYLAERVGEDDQSCKQVAAIKLIKSSVDMDRLRKRFKAERRIVAGLNHPSIARLLESGVLEDGTPYFALDFVEGQPIDQYCQTLDLESRLKVFCKVCDAVAYAHKNLVVHCDLKPSNILASSDGTPHLLDFGVARLLAEAGDNGYQTQTLWPCSPRYSSPEQIKNEAVTTATGVFALGIVLCELASGAHPFDPDGTEKGFDIVERIYRGEPRVRILQTKLSISRRHWGARQLGSELELVVHKALSQSPEDRYASVEYLIDDVQCCLDQRPISIKGNQLLYRVQKLIQRHPGTAISSLAAALTAIGAVTVTLWSGHIAQRESKYAQQQRSLAVSNAQTMIDDFATALETLSAPTKPRLELLKKVQAFSINLKRRVTCVIDSLPSKELRKRRDRFMRH